MCELLISPVCCTCTS